MNSLISINRKYMDLSAKELVNCIKKSTYTKGFEACINFFDEFEKKYLDNLVFEIKKNDMILQIHADIDLDIDIQIEYMHILENYSDYLGYPIVVTFHTKYADNKDLSLLKTNEYFEKIFNEINSTKVIISLENLNDFKNLDRLNKDEIRNTILNNEKIFFTYDIGHEIMDHGKVINLDDYIIDEIRNIHIHTTDDKGNDHMPIYKNDNHLLEIMKALTFIINKGYSYNVVYEYDLYACRGNNIIEKIHDYLNSIDYVSLKYASR